MFRSELQPVISRAQTQLDVSFETNNTSSQSHPPLLLLHLYDFLDFICVCVWFFLYRFVRLCRRQHLIVINITVIVLDIIIFVLNYGTSSWAHRKKKWVLSWKIVDRQSNEMMPDVNAWKSKRTYNDTNVNNKSMLVLFVVKHWIVYRPNTFGVLVVFIWTALKSNTIQMMMLMMTMKKARSGGVPATLTEQSQIERENSWAEEAKLIIVFHVIFDKYTHIINYSAVFGAHIQAPIDCICGANAKTHRSIRFSGICIPHIFFCFVCSFVRSFISLSLGCCHFSLFRVYKWIWV